MGFLKIEVTQDDIIAGEPWSPSYCPISIAARRAGLRAPMMSHDGTLKDDESGEEWHNVAAGEWARRFDRDSLRVFASAPLSARTFRFREGQLADD